MRQRAYLLMLTCILLTSFFVLMLPGRQRPSINRLVRETKHHISNLKNNLIKDGGEGLHETSTQLDTSYLQQLGLMGRPVLYSPPEGGGSSAAEPALVTAVEPGQGELAVGFVKSAVHFLPDTSILVYDLGLSRYETELLLKYCNSSACTIVQFDSSAWPRHVREVKLKAYRPLIIQMTLRDVGAVVWMDIDYRLTTDDLTSWLAAAKKSGVLAWQLESFATTTLTHPRMFEYFTVSNVEDYEFQHMVAASCLVVYNLRQVHNQLMLPWVKCALIENCIDPIGAQSTGCKFDKKPQYRYSGCHRYDVSALNIVLGAMFRFREAAYISTDRFFRQLNQDSSRQELSVVGGANGLIAHNMSAESKA